MQQKNVLIGAIIVLVLLILGGGYYFFAKSTKPQEQEPLAVVDETIPAMKPEELGLAFALRSDKKAAKFTIANAEDIESIEYQISYLKEVNGEEVPEGLIGEASPEDGSIAIDYREFGTCSSGVCRYDKVVSPVKLTLKITKTDGKIYSAEQTTTL